VAASETDGDGPVLRLRGVRKAYGGLMVLEDLDLEVPRGQRLALIGPSGSGKSTILRILMALEPIDAGRVEIHGEDLWQPPAGGRRRVARERHQRRLRSRLGMVFQHFNLFPHMSVLRNVTEALVHVQGMDREAARQRAVALLERVGLADKLDQYPGRLSGGQKQRVAIARALAPRPDILLFDEVTSALDPELVGEVLGVIRGLAEERNMTLLIVTHEMGFAREIADRVIFMEHGRIVEDDVPEVIFGRPRRERTAQFLASVLHH
jgi:polar amino acid transport system ATP-binding protein